MRAGQGRRQRQARRELAGAIRPARPDPRASDPDADIASAGKTGPVELDSASSKPPVDSPTHARAARRGGFAYLLGLRNAGHAKEAHHPSRAAARVDPDQAAAAFRYLERDAERASRARPRSCQDLLANPDHDPFPPGEAESRDGSRVAWKAGRGLEGHTALSPRRARDDDENRDDQEQAEQCSQGAKSLRGTRWCAIAVRGRAPTTAACCQDSVPPNVLRDSLPQCPAASWYVELDAACKEVLRPGSSARLTSVSVALTLCSVCLCRELYRPRLRWGRTGMSSDAR